MNFFSKLQMMDDFLLLIYWTSDAGQTYDTQTHLTLWRNLRLTWSTWPRGFSSYSPRIGDSLTLRGVYNNIEFRDQ